MGVITISLDKDSERMLRDAARAHFGDRKDALSKTIIKAISKLASEKTNVSEEFMKLTSSQTPAKTGKGAKI
jgi:hypothetical protein